MAVEVAVAVAMLGIAALLIDLGAILDESHNSLRVFLFLMSFQIFVILSNFVYKISVGQTYESSVLIFYRIVAWLDVILVT